MFVEFILSSNVEVYKTLYFRRQIGLNVQFPFLYPKSKYCSLSKGMPAAKRTYANSWFFHEILAYSIFFKPPWVCFLYLHGHIIDIIDLLIINGQVVFSFQLMWWSFIIWMIFILNVDFLQTCKINSLDFHETEDILVTASDDESIRLYNTTTAG